MSATLSECMRYFWERKGKGNDGYNSWSQFYEVGAETVTAKKPVSIQKTVSAEKTVSAKKTESSEIDTSSRTIFGSSEVRSH